MIALRVAVPSNSTTCEIKDCTTTDNLRDASMSSGRLVKLCTPHFFAAAAGEPLIVRSKEVTK
jgi:hypothetical protein